MEKIRENNMDLLRIICCISVIVIHVSASYCSLAINTNLIGKIYNNGIFFSNFINCITRFAVPCFVMLAGGFALSKKVSYKEFYAKKLKSIVLPTLIFSIFYALYYLSKIMLASFVNGTEIPIDNLIKILIDFLTGNCGYHMWYLYMIIFIYLITPVLYSIKEKIGDVNFNKLGIILLVVSIPFALTSTHKFSYDIGFSIYYVGYYILGYTIKEKNHKKSNKNFIKYLTIALILLFINSFFRLYIINQGMNDEEFQLPFIGNFSPISNFSVLVVIASILIYKAFANLSFEKNIINITKYSLYVYLMHALVLDVLYTFFLKLTLTPYIAIPLYTVIVFIGSLILSKIYLFIYKKIEMAIKFAKSANT